MRLAFLTGSDGGGSGTSRWPLGQAPDDLAHGGIQSRRGRDSSHVYIAQPVFHPPARVFRLGPHEPSR